MKVDIDWKKLKSKPPYVCGKCGGKARMKYKFDAYYCKPCNRWTEKKCGDKACEYCASRPKLPFPTATVDRR